MYIRHLSFVLFSLLIIMFSNQSTVYAEETVGHVQFLRGAVSAQNITGGVRILSDESPIFQGDTITTGKKSFAVLKFIDETKVSIRPDSIFAVDTFSIQENNESAIMNLIRGGMRVVTGYISKGKADSFKVTTAVATIGIRGTKLDARFCETDCLAEADKLPDLAEASYLVVGRVAYVKGELKAISGSGAAHLLSKGGPLYKGDKLITGDDSYAVLAFRDEGRMTLKANTEFHIEKLEFDPDSPDEGSAFFRLVKGGLRALTGIIGKGDQVAYQVATPVATIGIRGTGFDLQCQGKCISGETSSLAPGKSDLIGQLLNTLLPSVMAAVPDDGLFISVWEGEIAVIRSSGEFTLNQGKAVFVQNEISVPIELPEIPEFIQQAPEPRPDKIDIDHDALFHSVKLEGWPPGLYVSVRDGHVNLIQIATGLSIDLGKDEAGYVSTVDDTFIRIETIPGFEDNDPYFRFIEEDSLPLYNLLSPDTLDTGFQCVVQ